MADDWFLIQEAKTHNYYQAFVLDFFKSDFYRPMTRYVLFKISYNFFKLNPKGYRIIIFSLFILNNLLIYAIAERLLKRKDAALFTSLVYASRITPHSFTLYWISAGFQEASMVLFLLCSIYLYLQHIRYGNKLLYVSSLFCSILALISKEDSTILPLLIFLIELYARTPKSDFDLKTLLRRILPFLIISSVSFFRLYFLIPYFKVPGIYEVGFPLIMLCQNFIHFAKISFNNYFEMLIFGTLILLAVLKAENKKNLVLSISWFVIGLSPFIFFKEHFFLHYLSVSLVGFSLLISIGITYIKDTFPSVKWLLTPILVCILLFTPYSNRQRDKEEAYQFLCNMELSSNNVISYLKRSFPQFPPESLIYIKKGDGDLGDFSCSLGGGAAIKLNYDEIPVYFESDLNKSPGRFQGKTIYFFILKNNSIEFLNKSEKP
jgi:hypothetical protein